MRLGGILYSEGAQRSADRGERRCWRSKKQRVGRRGITQQAAAFAPLGPHRIRAGRARRRRGSVPVRIPRAEAAVTGRHHEGHHQDKSGKTRGAKGKMFHRDKVKTPVRPALSTLKDDSDAAVPGEHGAVILFFQIVHLQSHNKCTLTAMKVTLFENVSTP
ncbi:uncharacterized protein LOC144984512 isoform X1 [Oryzias latipes]